MVSFSDMWGIQGRRIDRGRRGWFGSGMGPSERKTEGRDEHLLACRGGLWTYGVECTPRCLNQGRESLYVEKGLTHNCDAVDTSLAVEGRAGAEHRAGFRRLGRLELLEGGDLRGVRNARVIGVLRKSLATFFAGEDAGGARGDRGVDVAPDLLLRVGFRGRDRNGGVGDRGPPGEGRLELAGFDQDLPGPRDG